MQEWESNPHGTAYETELEPLPVHLALCLTQGWESNPLPLGYEPNVQPLHFLALYLLTKKDSNPSPVPYFYRFAMLSPI